MEMLKVLRDFKGVNWVLMICSVFLLKPLFGLLSRILKDVFEEREVEGRINADLSESLETASGFEEIEDIELDSVDLSNIDPIQEFGFLVIGHEFDQYPKHMIRDIKKWDWLLDNPKRDSDDEDDSEKKGTTSGRRKRKKTNRGEDDDVEEEWTAESEGEELTRMQGRFKGQSMILDRKTSVRLKVTMNRNSSTNTSTREEEEESEDDEDETLGGFIVTDDDDTVEEDGNDEMDEDEEEEFIEDELED